VAVRAVVINFIYNSLSMEAANRLNLKMTLDEYLHEMNNRDQILQLKPSKTDVNDPLYCRKYAHTMIPLISYRMRPVGWDRVNVDGDSNKRAVYFGWNNITDFERKGIADVKEWLKKTKKIDVPEGYIDRNVLKFVQANFFQIDKAGEKLALHFQWLESLPSEPRLDKHTIKLLQSGCFYIFGRDKFYRPCVVMDAAIMAQLVKSDPDCVTEQSFTQLWVFLF